MRKKIAIVILGLVLIMCIPITVSASIQKKPISDTYKEGVYHFKESVGKKISLKLVTPDKPITIVIMESDGGIRYHFKLDEKGKQIDVFLDFPIEEHTVLVVGEGEVAFMFEE